MKIDEWGARLEGGNMNDSRIPIVTKIRAFLRLTLLSVQIPGVLFGIVFEIHPPAPRASTCSEVASAVADSPR